VSGQVPAPANARLGGAVDKIDQDCVWQKAIPRLLVQLDTQLSVGRLTPLDLRVMSNAGTRRDVSHRRPSGLGVPVGSHVACPSRSVAPSRC